MQTQVDLTVVFAPIQHQNELHNPLLAEREARGERIVRLSSFASLDLQIHLADL